MKKNDVYTLLFLILLTLAIAFISMNYSNLSYLATVILGLGLIKFLLVAFQFMELKKAHQSWKVLIGVFLSFFIGIILIII